MDNLPSGLASLDRMAANYTGNYQSGEGLKQKMRRGAQDERCPNLEDVEGGFGKVR